MQKYDILGVQVNNLSLKEAVELADKAIRDVIPKFIVTPNPEIIVSAQKNQEIKEILNKAYLSLADGVGLIIAGKILKKRFKKRLPGIDFMHSLLDLADKKEYGIYLLGASPAVIQTAAKKIAEQKPNLKVLGTMHGYFKTAQEEEELIQDILDAHPDILFVGMGSPRQEQWAYYNLNKVSVPLTVCVGGSFDVISGYLKRAPKIMQKLGIEWLYRLFQQPTRFKRMLNLPFFLYLVLKHKFKKNKNA